MFIKKIFINRSEVLVDQEANIFTNNIFDFIVNKEYMSNGLWKVIIIFSKNINQIDSGE
jgi:hypothetical protein